MMPTVYDIAIKNVISIEITHTLREAIDTMAFHSTRTIVVVNKEECYILTTDVLIDLQLASINPQTPLSTLDLPEAKILDKEINILNVLNQIDGTTEYMIIQDENKHLVGIVSYTDIIHNIDPQILMEKQTIGALMLNYQCTFVYEDSSTLQAIKQIRKSSSDSVIVVNSQEKPIGIFTGKDFIKTMNDSCDLDAPIGEYMSSPILTLNRNSTIATAMDFIKEKKFKRIIAVDERGYVAGIITQKDLLRVVYNKWIDFIREKNDKIAKDNENLLQSNEELKEIASVDFLTKLCNRQKFEHFLDYEISQQERYAADSFSLLVMDIDYFKQVNDIHGHLKGDMVLKEIAHLFDKCSRQSDIVARWGGEEFVMLLPHTNIEEAYLVAEKLRTTIELHQFQDNIHLTCSMGVSQYHAKDTAISLFRRADVALYKAKEKGRNQVLLESIECLS